MLRSTSRRFGLVTSKQERRGSRRCTLFSTTCCLPKHLPDSVVSERFDGGTNPSMFTGGAWAASATAGLALIMYTYQHSVLSSAELHALGLSTLAGKGYFTAPSVLTLLEWPHLNAHELVLCRFIDNDWGYLCRGEQFSVVRAL